MTASTQSPGEGELIARLRASWLDVVESGPSDKAKALNTMTEAADTIERLSERLARMEEERFFVVTAMASKVGPQTSSYGYRSRLLPASSSYEAVGIALRLMREAEPDQSFSEPAAIEISDETKASARARLSRQDPKEGG